MAESRRRYLRKARDWRFAARSPITASGGHRHDGSGGSIGQLVASTRSDQVGQYSPDGRQIAFVSGPYGPVGDLDANFRWDQPDPINLARKRRRSELVASGQKIMFSSPISGSPQVYAVSLQWWQTPADHQCGSQDARCRGTRAMASGYCASRQTGRFEVWKIASPRGAPVQVTRNGGYAARSRSMAGCISLEMTRREVCS